MMPSSAVQTFTDPEKYAMEWRAHGTALEKRVSLGRGSFAGKFTKITFDKVWMARLSESLPRVHNATHFIDRAGFNFLFDPSCGLIANGVEILPAEIRWRGVNEDYYQRTTGPLELGGISLPVEYITSVGATVTGRDLTPPQRGLTFTPAPLAMTKLRRLHSAAGALAEEAPAVLAHPEAARGLEQALIDAVLDCLGDGEIEEDRTAQRQHAAMMRRFHRVIEKNPDEPLYITEICKQVGASERTLNVCCQEHLGMAPKHYLLLRRMHMVRRALRESTPTETTVTEIATRYGFWQFGRLAGEYRSLFGELPSATLARPPHH
jgi:AraC-like DNA-binding protein